MAPKSAEPTRTGVSVTRTAVAADPRLPTPGTEIVRQYKSREVRVLVLAEGIRIRGPALQVALRGREETYRLPR